MKSRSKSYPGAGTSPLRIWPVLHFLPIFHLCPVCVFSRMASRCDTSSDVVLLLVMHTRVPPCQCRVPEGPHVPVAMDLLGAGIKLCAPELELSPELFVAWQGLCPPSCTVLHGPSVLGLSCRMYLGTESQKLLLPGRWQVQPAHVLHSPAGPDTASRLPCGPPPRPPWVQAAVAGLPVQAVQMWGKEPQQRSGSCKSKPTSLCLGFRQITSRGQGSGGRSWAESASTWLHPGKE